VLSGNRPIGVFDSGVGGLTVVQKIVRLLPAERVVYFGDTARVPYGTKSPDAVRTFAAEDTAFLLRFDPSMIVIACHTVSSLAAGYLARKFPTVSFLDVVTPSAEKALSVTRTGRIGVIGTPATIASGAYQKILCADGRNIRVTAKACPLFVPLAEEGWYDHRVAREIACIYLRELRRKKIDTLILGCTHYPLLKKVIRHAAGPGVRLVDASEEVAAKVKDMLAAAGVPAGTRPSPPRIFFSDVHPHVQATVVRFLGGRKTVVRRVSLERPPAAERGERSCIG